MIRMAKLVQSLALLLCLQRISELVIWRAVDLVRPVHLVTALDPLLTVCHPASAAPTIAPYAPAWCIQTFGACAVTTVHCVRM
jgi:hypothetical protein